MDPDMKAILMVFAIFLVAVSVFVGRDDPKDVWVPIREKDWKCDVSHEKRYEVCHAKSGCSWKTEQVCDKWSRKLVEGLE